MTPTTYEIPTEADLEALKGSILSDLYPTRDTRLIGLSGYARSGKNAVGRILENDYGYRQESFAQALKNVAAEINPQLPEPYKGIIPGATLPLSRFFLRYGGWDEVKDEVPAAREFLQRLGVACRDQIGPDVWVDALARRLSVHPSARYVITDVRFPNEAEFITNRGGQVWRIERPGTQPVNSHTSETALDDWAFDRTIVNDGSLADLRRSVESGLA